jgi:hypothetical protein
MVITESTGVRGSNGSHVSLALPPVRSHPGKTLAPARLRTAMGGADMCILEEFASICSMGEVKS